MSAVKQIESHDLGDPFLGVARSLTGRVWRRRAFEARFAELIATRMSIPLIAAELLVSRGVMPEDAERHLNPTLRDDLPDPYSILDMEKAANRIADAVIKGEGVGVFGDYDVDGATSSALIVHYFRALGRPILTHIPDRMREGYGPNAPALLNLGKKGAHLIITVDCGTLSFEPLQAAKDAGLDVIVCDHHKAETELPAAVAVVNPNRLDDTSDLGQLAAVGVTFMMLIAVNKVLRERGFFGQHRAPDLISLLDIVALGTVCDVVPLTGINRTFVSQGLKVMAKRQNIGLVALSDVGRISEAPAVYHLGFVLGPRLNAGGRVGEAGLGLELLTCADPIKAEEIARKLDGYNTDRREIEAQVQEEAIDSIEREYGVTGSPQTIALVAGKGWHPGVIGIVASRLKEKYGVPAIVIGIDPETGVAKGSGRSITGVDLGAAVIEATHKGLLVAGGGHAMAAGLTAEEDKIEALKAFFSEYLEKEVEAAKLNQAFWLDGDIATGGLKASLVDAVDSVGPFGVGNPGPRFALRDVALVAADIVGTDHLRLRFKGKDGTTVKVMAFRMAFEPMGEALRTGIGRRYHVAGRIKKDDWMGGDQAEMTLEDAAMIGPP